MKKLVLVEFTMKVGEIQSTQYRLVMVRQEDPAEDDAVACRRAEHIFEQSFRHHFPEATLISYVGLPTFNAMTTE